MGRAVNSLDLACHGEEGEDLPGHRGQGKSLDEAGPEPRPGRTGPSVSKAKPGVRMGLWWREASPTRRPGSSDGPVRTTPDRTRQTFV